MIYSLNYGLSTKSTYNLFTSESDPIRLHMLVLSMLGVLSRLTNRLVDSFVLPYLLPYQRYIRLYALKLLRYTYCIAGYLLH